jgi:hypothetical protein
MSALNPSVKKEIWRQMLGRYYNGDRYLCYYIERQQKQRRLVRFISIAFSGAGILGWKVWEQAPVVFSVLSALTQLLMLMDKNRLIVSDSEIEQLGEIRMMYHDLYNRARRLWTGYYIMRNVSDADAIKRLEDFDNEYDKIISASQKVEIAEIESLRKKAEHDGDKEIEHLSVK